MRLASATAVLLDSGGVLMQPIGGQWNPRADFEQTLAVAVPALAAHDVDAAIDAEVWPVMVTA